jgi:hypothetical protein
MKTKKIFNKPKKVVSLKRRNNVVGFKKTKRRSSKKTAKRMRGGAAGDVIRFAEQGVEIKGSDIKHVYRLINIESKKKYNTILVDLKKRKFVGFILKIEEETNSFILATNIDLKLALNELLKAHPKNRDDVKKIIQNIEVLPLVEWNKFLKPSDKENYAIPQPDLKNNTPLPDLKNNNSFPVLTGVVKKTGRPSVEPIRQAKKITAAKLAAMPPTKSTTLPKKLTPEKAAEARAKAAKSIFEIVKELIQQGIKPKDNQIKMLFRETFNKGYKRNFEVLERGVASLANVARFNNRSKNIILNINSRSKMGNEHIWRLLNQKLTEFAYFKHAATGDFQIIGYSFGYSRGKEPKLSFDYVGMRPIGKTQKSKTQIIVNFDDIFSSLTRLNQYYFDYWTYKEEKTKKNATTHEEANNDTKKPSHEEDEDLVEVYQINMDIVFQSFEKFLLGETNLQDKDIIMNYIAFQSLRKILNLVRINSITICFNTSSKDDILRYYDKTEKNQGIYSIIEKLNRNYKIKNIAIINKPYIKVIKNKNTGPVPALFELFTSSTYSYGEVKMYMSDFTNRIFDNRKAEIIKLIAYLQRVNYKICIKIESNPKPYLKFDEQKKKYKTFLSQLLDRDIFFYSNSMTKYSSEELVKYIGFDTENFDFIQDITNIQKMVNKLKTQYIFLKSDKTDEDLRIAELKKKTFEIYLQEIEIINKILTKYNEQLKNSRLKAEDYTIEINFYDNFIKILENMLAIIGNLEEHSPYTILNAELAFHIRDLETEIETNFSEELLEKLVSLKTRITKFTKMREELVKLLEDYRNIKAGVETLPEYETVKHDLSRKHINQSKLVLYPYPTRLKFKHFAEKRLESDGAGDDNRGGGFGASSGNNTGSWWN